MLFRYILAALVVQQAASMPAGETEVSATNEVAEMTMSPEHGRELFPAIGTARKIDCRRCFAPTNKEGIGRSDIPVMALGADAQGTKNPVKALEQLALNDEVNIMIESESRCDRRRAVSRAFGLAAGLGLAAVNAPSFAAETKNVKMGSDSGQLVFVPDEVKICKGDSVTWINNKGGPHNVVFDEENIPAGVDQEAISMDDQLGDEGATFTKKFDVAGTYGYYCEPHRGAGMQATLIVQ